MERAFPPPGGHVRQESAGRGKKGGFIRQALRLPAGYGRHIRLAFQILDRRRNFMMRCCPLPCSPGVLPVRQAEEAQAAVRRRKTSGVSEGLLRPRAVALIFAFGFFRESHFEPAALDQGRYVLSHGEGHGFASQELREFLTGAGVLQNSSRRSVRGIFSAGMSGTAGASGAAL